jgi:hypothetical protein
MTTATKETNPTSQHVTIFSNGATNFRREIKVEGGEQVVSIPVRRDYIGDVLDSLQVKGNVRLAKPASFSPANDAAGTLTIDSEDVLGKLATALGGATVRLRIGADDGITGQLMGLDSNKSTSIDGTILEDRYFVVLTQSGIRRYDFDEVREFEFVNTDVREEVQKALQRKFQAIKPNSTFVDLTLAAEGQSTALVEYTVPTAAWKTSYRLTKTATGYDLQGFAIVDNNTDEAWKDVKLTVVTGEPHTFANDLATSKVPHRKTVNVVQDTAVGGVEVEEGMVYAAGIAPASARGFRAKGGAIAGGAGGGPQMAGLMELSDSFQPAAAPQVDAKEVGDFSVFTAQELVTIPANKSALIPLFTTSLAETRTVLHFKSNDKTQRPNRSIKFKNETTHALGRGPCVVGEDQTFQGKCIIPSVKPGGDGLLPHAIETGVRIRCQDEPLESNLVSIEVAKGYYHTSTRQIAKRSYTIKNQKAETFELLVDHVAMLGTSEKTEVRAAVQKGGAASAAKHAATPVDVKEKVDSGWRVVVKLEPNAQVTLYVTETQVADSRLTFDLNTLHWFVEQFSSNTDLFNDSIKGVIAAKDQVDEKQEEIRTLKTEETSLTTKQERLRANLASVGSGTTQAQKWQEELANSENRLTTIQETELPAKNKELKALQKELDKAIKNATVEWKDKE